MDFNYKKDFNLKKIQMEMEAKKKLIDERKAINKQKINREDKNKKKLFGGKKLQNIVKVGLRSNKFKDMYDDFYNKMTEQMTDGMIKIYDDQNDIESAGSDFEQ